MKIDFNDLYLIYEEEIKKNVKNKRKIYNFEKNKLEYLIDIKNVLENNLYNGGIYNIFLIYKPKIRVVMSQNIYDKVINHYVARYILKIKLEKYLDNRNCATREDMGLSYAIKIFKKDLEHFKKYNKFYFLKMDISKYFYSIDHEVLKTLIKDSLTKEEYNLLCIIIDSTDKEYINLKINKLDYNYNLPRYNLGKGLPIGNMTSQFLAIFYLSKLHHYIKCNLRLKYYLIYMDDYIIIHEDKLYLKECLSKIEYILDKQYKLTLNSKKTFITDSKSGLTFLGYSFKIINKKTIIKLSYLAKKNIIKSLKRNKHLFYNNKINFEQLFSSYETYKNSYIFLNKDFIQNLLNKYWL